MDQTEREITCTHRLCGCYGTDLSDEEIYGGKAVKPSNFLGYCNKLFSALCCGRLCRIHWQMCGICATAQEGRQIDALVSVDRRRMDYVTFQSYFDYMNGIRKLRADKNGSLWAHFMAISKLSRMVLKTLFFVIFMLLAFSLAVAPDGFDWKNMIVVSTLLSYSSTFIAYFNE